MSGSLEYNEQDFDVPFVDEHGNPIPGLTDDEEEKQEEPSIEEMEAEVKRLKAEKERQRRQQLQAEIQSLRADVQRPAPVDDRMVVHNPVQPMVRHRQTDPEEQRWDQGYGQQRGPVRETGRYDAYCGRCGSPLSGFSNACDNCGQHRVERQQFASPAPVSSTPEPAAALTPAQQLLKIQEDKFDFEMRQKFANAAYQAAMNGPAPAKTAKAPVQQQRQRSTQPSRRQQNNRGRQPTPFRGSGFRYQPRSSQWVAPGYRQAHYVPVQRSGPCEPKIEKKVSQTRSRQANDMRQDQVLRGLGGLFEQRATPLQPQQQEKAEDLGDEGLIKEEPQDAAFDRPIKKERTDSGDEHE